MIAGLTPNASGVIYMTLWSLAYVVNDGLVRLATEEGLDVYQVLFLRGCGMVAIFAAWSASGTRRLRRRHLTAPLVTRVAAEVVSTACFFAALVRLEFANAQTILMLVPFAVTLVAAVTLGEQVDRVRYALVAVGFAGVVAVARPVPSQFSAWSLMVVAAAAGLVVREFATRRVEASTPPVPIALLTAVAITSMMGVISAIAGWGAVTARAIVIMALACLCLVAGYVFVIQAARIGDLSVSAPFRYTTVVGAVAVGIVMFDEVPDALTIAGCTLIVGAGVASARRDASAASRPPRHGVAAD